MASIAPHALKYAVDTIPGVFLSYFSRFMIDASFLITFGLCEYFPSKNCYESAYQSIHLPFSHSLNLKLHLCSSLFLKVISAANQWKGNFPIIAPILVNNDNKDLLEIMSLLLASFCNIMCIQYRHALQISALAFALSLVSPTEKGK